MAPQNLHRDADPVEAMLAEETAADHAKAKQRGQRVLGLADAIANTLHARGLIRGTPQNASVEIFHTIADELYGTAAIDIPTLRGDR